MTNKPLFSIITVCYNSEKTISRCIESILNQGFYNLEFIIIDGLSQDNTIEIIKSYESTFNKTNMNYIWISEKDNGIYDAMNKGIKMASGEYAFFMGSDDYIIEGSLEKLAYQINNKKYDNLIALPVKIAEKKHLSYPIINDNLCIVHHQGAIFNCDLLKKFFYSNKYKIHSDFDLITRYIKNYGIKYVDIPICTFSKGGKSTNGKDVFISIKELFDIFTSNGGNILSINFLKLIIRPLYYYIISIFK